MLALAPLLAAFAAIEPQLVVGGRDLGFPSFWYHAGALAFCYLLGLHWTEYRQILSASAMAALTAAIMTFATFVLTFAGAATGIIAAVIFIRFLPADAGVLALFVVVPGLAGVAWGLVLGHVAHRFVAGVDVPPGWLRLHALWGALAGPPMLYSAIAPHPPYIAAFTTTVAVLALTIVSWWWQRRCRRPAR